MKHQKNSLLSAEEVAKILGLTKNSIRVYARTGRLKPAKNDENGMFFAHEEVEEYERKRHPYPFNTKPGEREADASPSQSEQNPPPAYRDDAQLLQTVLSSVFTFLSAHNFAVGIQSLQEINADKPRLWDVKTPDCNIRVIAEDGGVSVLADSYQRQLEQDIATLKDQLREAQTKLRYLREKPRMRTLEEYAQPLDVWIDAREDGFFVYSKEFPFAAYERTENEALAAFRRTLWGYRAWLQFHEKQLTAKMQEDYIKLDDLLVER